MELLIILLLILLNGFFSMSEIALVSSKRIRLEAAASAGNKGAASALDLLSSPDRFLSTAQIGITLIGLLTGIYSGESITNDLEDYLNQFEAVRPMADGLAVTIVLIVITFFSLVLGELVPKRIGLTNPEKISSSIAPLMKVLSRIAHPFVWILTRTTNLFMRIFNIELALEANVTEEEIKTVIQEATSGGHIQKIEQRIVERVFILGDKKISSLMTPRNDLVFMNVNDDFSQVKNTINKHPHRIYPVFRNDKDDVIGVVFLKDLFITSESDFLLKTYLRPAHFQLESTSAYSALEKFKSLKENYALVINEYSVLVGMVTMDDILLALVGNTSDFKAESYEMKQLDSNSWLLDGQYPFTDFQLHFGIRIDPDLNHVITVAGLILEILKRIPKAGEKVRWNGLVFEVVDMDNVKIDKVLVRFDV
jgi:putative hemolysin